MEIKLLPLDQLKPFAKNPNKHPDKQINSLKKSMREFGFTSPILLSQDNMVIAGHARLQAATELGLNEVPTIFIDLPYEKAVAYVIADNQLARLAEVDTELMKELFEGVLQIPDFDVEAIGFDLDEVNGLLDVESLEVKEDNFNSDEDVETRCKEGDLWQLGSHRLLCGDCTKMEDVERLMGGARADILFTDPPYGIGTSIANDDLSETELFDFNSKWAPVAYEHTKEDSHLVCFHSTRLFWTALVNLQNSGFKFKRYLTLYKPNDCTFPWHGWILKSESILLFSKGNPEYIEVSPYQHDTIVYNHSAEGLKDNIGGHPCAKPIPFIGEFLKRFSGEKVLDLFLGSGTTLIACEQLNKICYGIDTDPHYCDIALKRFFDFSGIEPIREDGVLYTELV